VETLDNKYKLYFENKFNPTRENKILSDWKFYKHGYMLKNLNYFSVKENCCQILGSKIVGYDNLRRKYWETTPVVRIFFYSDFMCVYTESGSNYLLYW